MNMNRRSRFTRHFALAAAALGAAAALAVPARAASPAKAPWTIVDKTSFVSPAAPDAHVMTFLIDVKPGGVIPRHHHLVRSEVLVVKGAVTVTHKDGASKTYSAGQSWIEKAGDVHTAAATRAGPAELLWTIVLPDGDKLMPLDG